MDFLLKLYGRYQRLKTYASQVQKPTLFLGFTVGLLVGLLWSMLIDKIGR